MPSLKDKLEAVLSAQVDAAPIIEPKAEELEVVEVKSKKKK